jgi:hypothetical protein
MSGMTKPFDKIVIVRAVGELLFLYGLLGWIYGVLIQLAYPCWLPIQISHLTPWLRLDSFTIISFITSALGFFVWRLTRHAHA